MVCHGRAAGRWVPGRAPPISLVEAATPTAEIDEGGANDQDGYATNGDTGDLAGCEVRAATSAGFRGGFGGVGLGGLAGLGAVWVGVVGGTGRFRGPVFAGGEGELGGFHVLDVLV
jgi:hypothetical protein